MPDILCHLICADETTKTLNSDVKDIILANKKVFNLGAQGPDLFFYYKPQPWLNSNQMGDNGDMIHTSMINEFFINSAKRIKHAISMDPMGFYKSKIKTSAIHKEFAYLAGFLSHYALDTIGHPYIFYFSGVDSGHNHKYFECVLDTLISDIYNGKKAKLHKTSHAVTLTKHDSKLISLYLSKIIQDTFSKKIEISEIARCLKDMSSTLKSLYDPISLKRGTYKLVDKASKSKGRIITATFPAKYNKDVDFLNIKKDTWVHPCDDTIVYNDSFLELFKSSIAYSEKLITSLSHYIVNTQTQSAFEELIGNKQYDTGLQGIQDMKNEHIITHFRDVYKV